MRRPKNRQAAKNAAITKLSKAIRLEASDEHGFCTCVTCGAVHFWNNGIHAGHFLAGRRESLLFFEPGINPQCAACNSGNCSHVNRYAGSQTKERVTIRYTQYMMQRYGAEMIDECFRLKDRVSKTHTIEELMAMILCYDKRIKLAMEERGLS